MIKRQIPDDVLTVLSVGECRGDRYFLPAKQLDRKLYDAVNKVLTALGGKWNRSAKAHVFPEACEDLIDSAIETGSYTRPDDMGWFPTPQELAEQVVRLAAIQPGEIVLEPSAGEGALCLEMLRYTNHVNAFDIDLKRAQTCIQKTGLAVGQADFLQVDPAPIYDAIVMNPPFAKRADIHHVMHARKFLRPGGRLVAIMSGGIEFREDKLTVEFRGLCDSITRLPDDSFKSSGTNVRTVVVTMGGAA